MAPKYPATVQTHSLMPFLPQIQLSFAPVADHVIMVQGYP